MRERACTVLLTQRTDHLHDHAGQISFPGGRAERDDADAAATALREAAGGDRPRAARRSRCIGSLPTYTTGTGFIVTPVVALVQPRLRRCALEPSKWPRRSRCRSPS